MPPCSNVKKLRMPNIGSALQFEMMKMEILKPLLIAASDDNLTNLRFAKLFRTRRGNRRYLRDLMQKVDAQERNHLTQTICNHVIAPGRAPPFERKLKALDAKLTAEDWLRTALRANAIGMKLKITLRRPDDWHLHLRDGNMLRAILPYTSKHFARAIIMPNLVPPVVTSADAAGYRDRILGALPDGSKFEPLMTLYLTEQTDPDDVAAAHASGLIKAVKLYPSGATTNSASGVSHFDSVRPTLERMAEIGLPLCVHGEVTDSDIDIFDREAVFIDRVLDPIRRTTPGLRVVMEHITTSNAVDYARSQDETLGATITTHHLVINRNHILAGGIKPHYYCLPVAKREEHRLALRDAATSGEARFFLGTDSAPHTDANKLLPCGCAGCFTALNTMSILAQAFEEDGALDKLERFTSLNGPAFYDLPANEDTITLTKGDPVTYPSHVETPDGPVTVFDPGFDLNWRVE